MVFIEEQGQMGEEWWSPLETLVQENMLGGGGQPLFATEDVSDVHLVVVDDVGEVVCGVTIALVEVCAYVFVCARARVCCDVM